MILPPLPACRHRGPQFAPGQWTCASPKLVAPAGIITASTCRDVCPFVDHDPGAVPLAARFDEGCDAGELRRYMEEANRRRVRVRPDMLAVGVISAPRSPSTLPQTVFEMRRAGFSQVFHLFAEPETDVAIRRGTTLHRNDRRLGAWPNWRNAARRLLALDPAPFLLLCEDDVRFSADAAAGLQFAIDTLPHGDWGVVSLFTPCFNVRGRNVRAGWQPLDVAQGGWGSQAYCFSRSSLEDVLRNAEPSADGDQAYVDYIVTRALSRLGRKCYFHVPSLSEHAGQNISSIGHRNSVAMSAVQFDHSRRLYREDTFEELPGDLAVVTSHFNPAGYTALRDNYRRFAGSLATQGVDLWTVEVACGGAPFFLPAGERCVQLRSRDPLWHKERALNVLIDRLPARYDKVAWIDADVLFDDVRWAETVAEQLRQVPIVQCFSEVVHLGVDGQPLTGPIMSLAYAADAGHAQQRDAGVAAPGYAWAARRRLIERIGLYDLHPFGAGDSMMAAALLEWWDYWIVPQLTDGLLADLWDWGAWARSLLRETPGFVSGTIRHLYHGEFQSRRYGERAETLHELQFDPCRDLTHNQDALFEWSDSSGPLKDLATRHFQSRRDDGPSPHSLPGAVDRERRFTDCLHRADIVLPAVRLRAENCIATIASDGFEEWLDDMLGSLLANGRCREAMIVVIVPVGSQGCVAIAEKYGATVVYCRPLTRINATFKSALYSIAHVIDAERFLCLDADMIILDDLSGLFRTLETLPQNSILACREANDDRYRDLDHAFHTIYSGRRGELDGLLGADERERHYPLVVNDGLFAGSRQALLGLDGAVRELSRARQWTDEREDVPWRNQFIFNLVLARLDCGVELDGRYNLQLHLQDVRLAEPSGLLGATWKSRPVHVLHFAGLGRDGGPDKLVEWRGRFSRVRDPLVGRGAGDLYGELVTVLQRWVGSRGLTALRWSFYGTPDAMSAEVRDPGVLPALALLHYLIRSSGSRRVLECGTGFGISTACLASAVAHHRDGHVTTVDVSDNPERTAFWDMLPADLRRPIGYQRDDSIALMDHLIENRELFDAALLDSLHDAEHVLKEFERANRLVRPDGLILIHDVLLESGTVEQALMAIESRGFGVTRLWVADGLQADDNGLGLAVIQNRRRKQC